jgi:glucose-1-phosphate thymidylyltransferase
VQGSEIEHSIVLESSQILDIPTRIESSLMGRNVRGGLAAARPRAYRFKVGDN